MIVKDKLRWRALITIKQNLLFSFEGKLLEDIILCCGLQFS